MHFGGAEGPEACSSHRAPSAERSYEDMLPAGCAVGCPVVRGTQAVLLPETRKDLFKVLMAFVDDNDFAAVLELARRGGEAVDLQRKCTFSVSLRPDTCTADLGDDCPDELCVTHANILHYALCICAFHAAAALLVVCPELLRGKCNVSMIRNERPTPQARPTSRTELWAKAWYPSDIASFFSGLYSEAGPSPAGDEEQVDETREKYNIALVMLELFERDAEHMLLLGRGTQAERIASAGCDPDTFMLKLLARASLFLGGPYTGRRRPGAAAPLPVCCVDAALFARAGVTPSQGAGGAW